MNDGGEHLSSGSGLRVTGRLIAAARALVGVSAEDFASACELPVASLHRLESAGSAWIEACTELEGVSRGLDHFGVLIVEESHDFGAGVRLKFTRRDVRQIARLEDEGGLTGSDDAP